MGTIFQTRFSIVVVFWDDVNDVERVDETRKAKYSNVPMRQAVHDDGICGEYCSSSGYHVTSRPSDHKLYYSMYDLGGIWNSLSPFIVHIASRSGGDGTKQSKYETWTPIILLMNFKTALIIILDATPQVT